jgi:hypothetical protein
MKTSTKVLAASFVGVAVLGSTAGYAIYDRKANADALVRVREEARLRGANTAMAEIRAGHIVLRRVCNSPAAVEWWQREYGVACPLNIFQSCGYGLPNLSEAQRLRELAYDQVMVRHVRAKFGPKIFQTAREQVKAISEPPTTPGGV